MCAECGCISRCKEVKKRTWPFGRQTPDNNLMRFVSKRFPGPADMLDIGSGEGANARELKKRRHKVITIDKDPECKADITWDISTLTADGWIGAFDLVYDVNTLCHVVAPLEGLFTSIKEWLKPEGIFFSICPQFGSCTWIMEGKDFTRFLTMREVERFYAPFSDVRVGSSTYHLPDDEMYASWIVEARP
jgi:SAM-dependent methyltransferase